MRFLHSLGERIRKESEEKKKRVSITVLAVQAYLENKEGKKGTLFAGNGLLGQPLP